MLDTICECAECGAIGKIESVQAYTHAGNLTSFYLIMCQECGFSTSDAYLTVQEASAQWNLLSTKRKFSDDKSGSYTARLSGLYTEKKNIVHLYFPYKQAMR